MNKDKNDLLRETNSFYMLMLATGFFRYNLEKYDISLSESLDYQAICKELGWVT